MFTLYHKVLINNSLVNNIWESIKVGNLLDPLFDEDSVSEDLTKGVAKVWENANNNIPDLFEDATWGNMSQKQIEIVKGKLVELGKQGKLTALDVGSIANSFRDMTKSTFLTTLKGTLLDFGKNLLAAGGITVVITLVAKLIGKLMELHKTQEELIQDGKEASEFMDKQRQSYNENVAYVEEIQDRYAELSKGVKNGINQSLSQSEFEEFHQIGNKLGEMFPQLVTGYDSLGNAILSCASNQDTLNEALEEQRQALANDALVKEETIVKGYNEKVKTDKGWWENLTTDASLQQKYNLAEKMSNAKNYDDFYDAYLKNSKAGDAIFKELDIDYFENEDWKTVQSKIAAYAQQVNQEIESASKEIRQNMADQLLGEDVFNQLDEKAKNGMLSLINSFSSDTIRENIEKYGKPSKWIDAMFAGVDAKSIQDKLSAIMDIDPSTITKNNIHAYDSIFNEIQSALHLSDDQVNEFKISFGLDEESLNTSINAAKDNIQSGLKDIDDANLTEWLNTLSQEDLEIIANIDMSEIGSLQELKDQLDQIQEDSRISIDIDVNKNKIDQLKTAMSESRTGTGLSKESTNNLISMFGDDAYKAFEKTANGIHLNTEAINALQAEQEALTKIKFKEQLEKQTSSMQKQQNILKELGISYEDVSNGINSANLSQDQWTQAVNAASQISILDGQIRDTEILMSQYEGLTSAYQKWIDAQAGGSEGDMYDTIYGGIEKSKELYDKGLVGKPEFKAFAQLLSFEDLSNASTDEIVTKYETNIETLKKYFTEGADGARRFVDEYATWNEELQKYEFDFNDEELAKELDISVEAVQAILGKLKDYGFEVDIDTTLSQENLAELETKAAEAKKTLEGMENIDINVDYNVNDMSITELEAKKQELESKRATLNVDSSEYKSVSILLEQIDAQIKFLEQQEVNPNVSTADLSNAYSLVEQFQNALQSADNTSLSPEVDTESVDELAQKIADLPDEVKTSIGIEGTTPEEIKKNLEATPITIPVAFSNPTNNPTENTGDNTKEINVVVNGEEDIDKLNQAISNIQSSTTVTVSISVDQSQLTLLSGSLFALTSTEYPVTVKIKINEEALATLKTELASLNLTVSEPKIEISTSTALSAIDTVKNALAKIQDKIVSVTVKTGNSLNVLNSIVNRLSAIRSKTVTVTTNAKTVQVANGTAHSTGTITPIKTKGSAFAHGNWGLNKNVDHALVGELGQEIVVRDGHYFTVGEHGAEFVGGLKKGDIIFNHKQSEELLKKGYVTSGGGRGKALADGTALSSGSGKWYGGLSKYNNKKAPSYSSNKVQQKVNNAIDKAAEKAASTATSALDKLSNLFDWIAIKLEKVSQATERATKKIELAIGLSNKQSANADAINAIQQEISANRTAYSSYMKQADTTASSLGLSNDIIQKIQNGSYDITEYDEDTNKKIDEYKKWYDLAQGCLDTITDLEQKEKELAQQRLDNIEDYYDAITELYAAQQKVNTSDNEVLDAYGSSNISEEYKNNIKENIKIQEQTLNNLVQKLSDYQSELDNLVAKGYIKEGSDAWYEAQTAIQNLTSEINETDIALIEFKDQLREIQYRESQYIIDGLSRFIDKISNIISLNDKRGNRGNIKDYENKIEKNNSKIQEIYNLRNKKLDEMKYYDVSSEKYQEIAEEVSKLDSEIFGLLEDNEELAASIRELRWTEFNKGIESLEGLTDEAQDLKDLLNEDSFFDKSGQITDDGLAFIALTAQQIKQQQQIVSDYTEGLKKLDEELAKGTISTEEYQEEQKEFLSAIRDAVGNVEDYKNQIIDLYKQQMQAEVDALDKVIDKRKEAHEQKVRYEEYDKKVRQQNKEVLSLEAQIKALEGVTNQYALAEKKRLEAQLASAKEDLDSTRNDHKNEMISQGFDEMSEGMHEALDNTLYELTHNAEKQQEVVANMLNNVVNMYKDAYGKIQGIIGNTGFVPSAGMNQNISGLGTQQGAESQMQIQKPSTIKPNNSASGIITDNPIKNPTNDRIETDISQGIDTSNRKVAELTISPASLSLMEGQSGTINYTIRPSDAKNKQLSWISSNPQVATVNSNGVVTAKSAGSATISIATTDGSGLAKQCAVSVAKKPEPPKPTPPPSSNNSNGADGVPNVGDAVIYAKGKYYYDSQGITPSGSQMLGQTVYISKINKKSWATKPYHLTRDKAGHRALGWVSLDQISGYKKGITNVPYTQLAEIDENNKKELVYRYNGHNYSVLTKGSGVIPATPTKNLMEFGSNPQKFLQEQMKNVSNVKKIANVNLSVDNMMNIEKVTQDSVPSLESLVPKLTDAISKEIMSEINKLM